MDKPKFVYVTYIATTPEKLWEALTSPEFSRRYWFGMRQESDWKPGAPWRLVDSDGIVWDSGEIVEVEPLKRAVISWRHQKHANLHAVGFSRATYELEPVGSTVKLTVTHEAPEGGGEFIEAVSGGWPKILSSLKSLLETGRALPDAHDTSEKVAAAA